MSETFYDASNLSISNGFGRNRDRYYLEEFFTQLPSMEAPVAVTQSSNLTTAVTSHNKNTMITTASTSSDVAAKQWVEFTFTNQLITANSVVIINAQDSADNTADSEKLVFQVNDITAGSCEIRCINAHDDTAATAQIYKIAVMVDPQVPSNLNYCMADSTGASAVSALATGSACDESAAYNSDRAGINLITSARTGDSATDDASVVLLPRTTTSQEMGANGNAPSAWTGILWGTENQVEWECAISVANIANVCFWAGLKLTKTPVLVTDADQAYFIFDSSDTIIGSSILTTEANMHFVYSVNNTDYTTDLDFAVAANTIYKLRISIDSDRKISIFVGSTNSSGTITPMTQYGLTSTAGTAGVTESTVSTKSAALTNDINLIPYVGVHSTSAAQDTITVYYEKISRTLFE